VGELNELASPNGRKGGQALPNSKLQRLNNFLLEIDVKSIQVKGNLFTWE